LKALTYKPFPQLRSEADGNLHRPSFTIDSTMRSLKAAIVFEGLCPTGPGMIEPSAT
jgi:hypothetical protein